MFNNKWKKRFINLAYSIAKWSKDPSTKVGCVIVNKDKRIISTGYNGFPEEILDNSKNLLNRQFKLENVIHAEHNAILNTDFFNEENCIMFITKAPCRHCANKIIETRKVSEVCYPEIDLKSSWVESQIKGQKALKEAGILITTYKPSFLQKLQMYIDVKFTKIGYNFYVLS